MQKQYDLDESTAHATIDRIKKQKANDEKKGEGEAEEGTNVGDKRTRRSQVICAMLLRLLRFTFI
jgi:hypothetical protein